LRQRVRVADVRLGAEALQEHFGNLLPAGGAPLVGDFGHLEDVVAVRAAVVGARLGGGLGGGVGHGGSPGGRVRLKVSRRAPRPKGPSAGRYAVSAPARWS